jgi:rRNA maturation endonuclease Nob1
LIEFIQTVLLLILLYVAWNSHGSLPLRRGTDRKVVLDTCALIDGRIVDIVQGGFVPEKLIVPQFIVKELQNLADGGDAHKRERARYGLEVVKDLQNNSECEVIIDKTDFPEIRETDDKLVALAKKIKAQLYTTDFNLNKVAQIEGVRVLNVNELAQALRPIALPGERKKVKIVQKGNNKNQGVGYLEDGTMVVVDGASKMINKTMLCEIVRVHQTVAGKMIFAIPILPSGDIQAAENARPARPEPSEAPGARPPAPQDSKPKGDLVLKRRRLRLPKVQKPSGMGNYSNIRMRRKIQ